MRSQFTFEPELIAVSAFEVNTNTSIPAGHDHFWNDYRRRALL
jgi:hypothetical protein